MASNGPLYRGSEQDGRDYSYSRSISMTKTEPPASHRWTTEDKPQDNSDTDGGFRNRRLAWLDQFDLEISTKPERGYRYWRWLSTTTTDPRTGHRAADGTFRRVVWWERRKWTDPLPAQPGLWPLDE